MSEFLDVVYVLACEVHGHASVDAVLQDPAQKEAEAIETWGMSSAEVQA